MTRIDRNRNNLALFRAGVCVFWKEQREPVKAFLQGWARAVLWAFAILTAGLAVVCACAGFYLTRAPVSMPWALVWTGRLSAVFWLAFGLRLFAKGMVKKGREATENPGHYSGCVRPEH